MGLLGGVDIRPQRAALHRGGSTVRFHCDAAQGPSIPDFDLTTLKTERDDSDIRCRPSCPTGRSPATGRWRNGWCALRTARTWHSPQAPIAREPWALRSRSTEDTYCLGCRALSHVAAFPDSAVRAIHCAPGDYPSGKQGDLLTVAFTVLGIA